MDRKQVTDKVIKLAAAQGDKPVESVSAESHFVNDLDFDSLDSMNFVMTIEDEFGVAVPDDKIDQLLHVRDVIDHILRAEGTPGPKKLAGARSAEP